jgi:GNAT superfamily N-acetyltransferase
VAGPADIKPTTLPANGFDDLVEEARAERVAFLDRMMGQWQSGVMRFDGPGETLLGTFQGERLIGICGLSIDPYLDNPRVGRLRHLFVGKAGRGKGIGSALVDAILAHARDHFVLVRLRTDADIRGAFYASFGFRPIDDDNATHQLRFG